MNWKIIRHICLLDVIVTDRFLLHKLNEKR